MKRLLILGTAALALAPLGLVLLLTVGSSSACAPDPGTGPVSRLDAEQTHNARTIVGVGWSLAVPDRGLVVAVATALQESGLRNLTFGDRDSLGLFQQRPSQGWGSPAQVLDPVYAATRFYTALRAVPGWQQLPVTAAAQAVQRSAYPAAYARWAGDAARIVTALTGTPTPPVAAAGCAAPTPTGSGPAGSGPAGTVPASSVPGVLAFAAAQIGDGYVLGANGPDAWDCSSLVRAAVATAGLDLPRTAAQQYDWARGRGQLLPGPARLGWLRPGDLLFSHGARPNPAADGEPVGHVALYAGRGLVIEAKGATSGVTAARYSDTALGSVTWVARLAADAPAPATRPPRVAGPVRAAAAGGPPIPTAVTFSDRRLS